VRRPSLSLLIVPTIALATVFARATIVCAHLDGEVLTASHPCLARRSAAPMVFARMVLVTVPLVGLGQHVAKLTWPLTTSKALLERRCLRRFLRTWARTGHKQSLWPLALLLLLANNKTAPIIATHMGCVQQRAANALAGGVVGAVRFTKSAPMSARNTEFARMASVFAHPATALLTVL
jgi:hypothetical protein